MVRVEYSNSDLKDCCKTEILDDYSAERLFLKLTNGAINPSVLDEGPYTITGLSVQEDGDLNIYDSATFIP